MDISTKLGTATIIDVVDAEVGLGVTILVCSFFAVSREWRTFILRYEAVAISDIAPRHIARRVYLAHGCHITIVLGTLFLVSLLCAT